MAQFTLGHKKYGGRKRGTHNRANRQVREVVEDILNKSIPERLLELSMNNPGDEIEMLLNLLPYCYPRVASIEFKVEKPEECSEAEARKVAEEYLALLQMQKEYELECIEIDKKEAERRAKPVVIS